MKNIFTFFIFYLISTQNIFSMSCQQLCRMGDYSACQKGIMGISCEDKVNRSSQATSKKSEKYQHECDANNGESCLQLGILFEKGKEVQQDKLKAGELYKKACNLDNANACAVLGTYYAEGIGTNGKNLDFDKAFMYTEKACYQNIYPSCVNLGIMYLEGKGIEKSFSKAVNIFKKTCNNGSQVACDNYKYLKNKKTFSSQQSEAKINKSITPLNNVKKIKNSHTSNLRTIDKVNTVAGTFKVIEDNDTFIKYIQFNGKNLITIEDPFIGIQKTFKLKNHTIVIVWSNYSPNGNPSYRIFDIHKNEKVTHTTEFSTSDYTFKAYKKGSDTIEIDLGFEDGKKKIVIYSNGKLHKKKKKAISKGISVKNCKWLYSGIYEEYLRTARPCTKKIGYALGNSPYHGYYALTQNPNFNKSFFREMLTEDCSSGIPLSYQEFSRAICQGNNNYQGSNKTSTQSTCSKYHVVTVKQLNIRNKPKKPSKIVGKVNRGQVVCIYDFSGKWGRSNRGWISGKYLERSQADVSISTSSKKSKIDPYMITSIPLPTHIDKVYAKLGKAYTVQLPDPNEYGGSIGQIHKWQYAGGILSVVGNSDDYYKVDTKAKVFLSFLQGPKNSKVTTLYGIVINKDNIIMAKRKILTYIKSIGIKNYILKSSKLKSSFYGENYDYLIRFKDPKTKLYNLFYFEKGLLKNVIQGTFDFSMAG